MGRKKSRNEYDDRAFIAAPYGANLSLIERVLGKHRWRALTPANIKRGRPSVAENLVDLITSCDLFIGVWDIQSRNGNLLFEAGIAIAMAVPVVLIAPLDAEVPSDLRGIMRITATDPAAPAVQFALEQVLEHSGTPRRRRGTKSPTAGGLEPATAHDLRQRLHATETERELADVVADALEATNALVVREARQPHGGRPDLAIWLDELEPLVGNPVVIEVRKNLRNSRELKQATEQVESYLRDSQARWALLVYQNGSDALMASVPAMLGIQYISAEALIDALERGALPAAVATYRNRFVHGVGR